MKYNDIKLFAQQNGIRDDLLGSFLSAVSSDHVEQYVGAAYNLIFLGYAYQHNITRADAKTVSIVSPDVIHKDIIRSLPQTLVTLNIVVRRSDFLKTKDILERCIELLFTVGMNYDGRDLGGSPSKTSPDQELRFEQPAENKSDYDLPSDITEFLNGIL